MEIRPVDGVSIVEQNSHDDREKQQPQRRNPSRKKEKIPSGPVYTSNGTVEEEPPPNIDVLV
jgi:hypothetical protein